MPTQINPQEFVTKWRGSSLKESAAYVEHFIDVCRLLGHGTPAELDPNGEFFTFQKDSKKQSGKMGFADVWYKDRFGMEYKSKGKDLDKAYSQLLQYQGNLLNPPLLIVSDFEKITVRTHFSGLVATTYTVTLDDILDGGRTIGETNLSGMQVLNACFYDPDKLRPAKTTEELTKQAAEQFGKIADSLRIWHPNNDEKVARFLTRLLFCMFASDTGILPKGIVSEIVDRSGSITSVFGERLTDLFKAMSKGGQFWGHDIAYFNGGLFDVDQLDGDTVHVDGDNKGANKRADALNWADVEPSVFGTLFERILNPAKRSQLGAHYSSRADIELIVEPVLMWPLEREWDALQAALNGSKGSAAAKSKRLQDFIDRLGKVTVLDPACGSGNFLYVSLAMLKGLEQKVVTYGAEHGVTGLKPAVHPRQLHGIEKDDYAYELASIVV